MQTEKSNMENLKFIISSPADIYQDTEPSKLRSTTKNKKSFDLTHPAIFSTRQIKGTTPEKKIHNIIRNTLTPRSLTNKSHSAQSEESLADTESETTIRHDKNGSNKRHNDNDECFDIETKKPRNETINLSSKKWHSIDEIEKYDIMMVAEYSDEIFNYLYTFEKETLPTHNYLLDTESDYHIRPEMRAILVDWLVEVHQKFQYTTDTLLLAISLMDRFLSQNKVTVGKLQLLAITSLFVAAKFEEVKLPKISAYSYLTDGAASSEDIRTAEMYLFDSLDFNINFANPINFMKRISKVDGYNSDIENTGIFLLECATCSPKFINLKPSLTSGMSMYIARKVHLKEKSKWDDIAKHYSGEIDVTNDTSFQTLCKELILEVASPSTKLNALIKKFQSEKYDETYSKILEWCKYQVFNEFYKLF